jgi:hypothetical protein
VLRNVGLGTGGGRPERILGRDRKLQRELGRRLEWELWDEFGRRLEWKLWDEFGRRLEWEFWDEFGR